MKQVAFSFDAAACTGCEACVVACALENDLDGNGLSNESWRHVATFNAAREPDLPVAHLSIACNHCEDPPCASACPALAYEKDPNNGIVTLHADRCIGCRYCSWACPYDAPRFSEERGVMTKCTFCSHRQAEGLQPACVEQCPTGALGFGVLNELEGVPNALGMPTLDPGPSIRFTTGREKAPETAFSQEAPAENLTVAPSSAPVSSPVPVPKKIQLRSEWPLVGFTMLAAWLVSSQAANAFGKSLLPPWLFAGLALVSLVLSSLHLGQKLRAWRAILNIRRSWLSREIAFYSTFVGLSFAQVLVLTDSRPLIWASAVVGMAALFAIDRVYDIVRQSAWYRKIHSADVVLMPFIIVGVWLEAWAPLLLVGAIKLFLYLRRKLADSWKRPGLIALRLTCGFLLPLGAIWLGSTYWPLWVLASTLIGDLVDRCEFYDGLVVPTPRGEMLRTASMRSARSFNAAPTAVIASS